MKILLSIAFLVSLSVIILAVNISPAADLTVIENVKAWKHPVKEVLQQHQVKLYKVELLNNKTYPIFYVGLPYDPHLGHNDNYFRPLYYEILRANGFWNYSFISPDDKVRINIKWDKKTKTLSEDLQDLK